MSRESAGSQGSLQRRHMRLRLFPGGSEPSKLFLFPEPWVSSRIVPNLSSVGGAYGFFPPCGGAVLRTAPVFRSDVISPILTQERR